MRFIGAALLALLGLGCAGAARAAPAHYAPAPCAADFGPYAPRFTCGLLTVDETRGGTSGRRVAIPVAILKAASPRGLPPVVYLHGGPGGGVIGGLAGGLSQPGAKRWIGVEQDWIFFDQRGGRLAAPNLDCGGLALNDAGPDSDATVAALKACAARHVAAGVDFSRYNAVEVARDVGDLRTALGLKAIDLFGVSYGTRIALEVVRTAPAGVRAVVLDSFWPPEAKWAEDGAAPVARAVRQILALCRADPACGRDKAGLEPKVDALARRWLAAPQGGADGRLYPVGDFAQYLMDAAYEGEAARALPGDLQKLVDGDFSVLAAYDAERSVYIEGQHMAHLCKEQFPFERRDRVAANAGADPLAQALATTLVRYFDACEGFPVGPADPAQARAVVSDLPILIVNAGIDPGCPPELARAALKSMRRGRFLLVPNVTHGVTRESPCAAGIAQGFLRDPAAPLDTACIAIDHARFDFTPPPADGAARAVRARRRGGSRPPAGSRGRGSTRRPGRPRRGGREGRRASPAAAPRRPPPRRRRRACRAP